MGSRGARVAKSSAIPYAFRGRGLIGVLSHLSSIVLGDAKFNRSASSIDMRHANLNFSKSLLELLLQACPKKSKKEIDTALKEAQIQIKRLPSGLPGDSIFPEQWDSGIEMQILLYCLMLIP